MSGIQSAGKSGKVYVANCTQQNQQINFRLPDSRRPLSVGIAIGRQAFVGDLSIPEIDAMLDQLGPYGLVELGQEGKRDKVTYLFNVGAPVPSAAMQRMIDRNRGILRDEGTTRRKEAAVAANAAMNTDDTPLKNVTMDIEEIDSGTLGNESDRVGEGYRIDNEANTSENKPRRRARAQ